MKHYVLDTGFFSISRDYYPEAFPTLWEKMNESVDKDLISSVIEVKRELDRYGGEQEHLLGWAKDNKHIFTQPTTEEQMNIRRIFEIPDFTKVINDKEILRGNPQADPFVIAKVMACEDGVVVTGEKHAKTNKNGKRDGAPKIPDICDYFKVECLSPRGFMKEVGWKF